MNVVPIFVFLSLLPACLLLQETVPQQSPSRVLTGTVSERYYVVEKTGTNEDDYEYVPQERPLAGATVTLYNGPRPITSLNPSIVLAPPKPQPVSIQATTDSEGRFRLQLPSDGKWTADWSASNFRAVREYKERSIFSIEKPVEVTVERGIAAPTGLHMIMQRPPTLIGKVRRANGQLVVNDDVKLIGASGFACGPTLAAPRTVHTDAQGRFRMTFENYDMAATAEFGVWHASGEYTSRDSFYLRPSLETHHTFRLTIPASIAGTVTISDGRTPVLGGTLSLSPILTGKETQAEQDYVQAYPFILDASRNLANNNSCYYWQTSPSALDMEGKFHISVIPNVKYRLTYETKDGVAEMVIRVAPGEHRTGVILHLKPIIKAGAVQDKL